MTSKSVHACLRRTRRHVDRCSAVCDLLSIERGWVYKAFHLVEFSIFLPIVSRKSTVKMQYVVNKVQDSMGPVPSPSFHCHTFLLSIKD